MSTTASDLEKAVQLLRAKQQEYYVQWVKDAIETEKQRKLKLERATSRDECKRFEKQFEKERIKEKERMHQIQEDHQLIVKAKLADWKAHGVPASVLAATSSPAIANEIPRADQLNSLVLTDSSTPAKPKAKPTKMSKATLDRLSASVANEASGTDSAQELAFQRDAIRKEDHTRLYRGYSKPLSSHSENLKAVSDTDLLHRKMNLLTQLHGVVSMQEKILHDDQCTVRSTVSSWKSVDFKK